MKKYWINDNIESIKNSFKCFQKKFSASSLELRDDMFSFDDGVFKYICAVSITTHSGYSEDDFQWIEDDSYNSVDGFNSNNLNRSLSFLISNIVPRLPNKNLKELTAFIRTYLVKGSCYKKIDWYTNYTCDIYKIEFEKVIELSKIFLKKNNLFREKHEFFKTN